MANQIRMRRDSRRKSLRNQSQWVNSLYWITAELQDQNEMFPIKAQLNDDDDGEISIKIVVVSINPPRHLIPLSTPHE